MNLKFLLMYINVHQSSESVFITIIFHKYENNIKTSITFYVYYLIFSKHSFEFTLLCFSFVDVVTVVVTVVVAASTATPQDGT